MREGYLDNRLVGRTFQITAQNLQGSVEFYGIYYHLHSADPLHLGDLVIVTTVNQHGITVATQKKTKGE